MAKKKMTAKQREESEEQFEEFCDEASEEDVEETAASAGDLIDKLADNIPSSLEEMWDDIVTLYNMLIDYKNGEYDLPWRTVVAIIGALAYFACPVDAIPDVIPVVGFIDDAGVLTLAVNAIWNDIEEYREWCEEEAA